MPNKPSMSLESFEDALDTYGGDLGRWPADLRRSAEVLVEKSEEAKALLHQAEALDAALAADPVSTAPADLADRIMQRVAEQEVRVQNVRAESSARSVKWRWLPRVPWPVPRELVAVCCGTIVGVVVGTLLVDAWPTYDRSLDFFNLASAPYFFG